MSEVSNFIQRVWNLMICTLVMPWYLTCEAFLFGLVVVEIRGKIVSWNCLLDKKITP